jgi:peptidase C25-like protein
VESLGDAGAAYSLSFLDRFEVAYPAALAAAGGAFEGGFAQPGRAAVSDLPADGVLVDITSPDDPAWLFGASPTADGLAFRAEADHRYLALSRPSLRAPEVRRPLRSALRSTTNRADYLLVAPRAFLAAAQPLLDLRAAQGLAVKAAALEEVFQEFGHGEATPQAIRELVAHAYHFWQAPSPRYVVLLGDGSYDYKNRVGGGAANVLPVLMTRTSFLWTASDLAYAAVNGEDLVPDLAIGRLPAANVAEAETLVAKIVAFETGGGTLADGNAVLVADNPDPAGDFEASADAAEALLAPSHTVEKVLVSELGAGARPAITAAFDGGASLVSYLGHGGIAVWASENVFNNQDVAALAPQSRQPLLLTMDCLNGYFHFPFLNALAEELLKAPDKGAIASFAPSGLSLHDPADVFHQALLRELTSGQHERLGDAVFAAQVDYAQTGAFPELLSIYHLLGDPALRIR